MPQTSPVRAPAPPPTPRLQTGVRFEAMDAARGIGALLVVFGHYNAVIWPERYFFTNYSSGYLVVDVFFLLSGFVLAHAFFDRAGFNFPDYAAKRIFRLWPLHMATLLAFAALMVLSANPVSLKGFTLNALMLHNVGIGDWDMVAFNFPSWSISVEFLVNLLIGFLILAIPSRRLSTLILAAISLISAAILFFTVDHLDQQVHNVLGGVNTGLLRGFVSFPLGILAYRLFRAHETFFLQTSFVRTIMVAGMIAIFFITLCLPSQGGADLAYLPFYAVFMMFLASPGAFWLGIAQRLLFLGRISFAVYLVHALVLKVMHELRVWPQDYATGLLIAFTATLLLAIAAHYGIERPAYEGLKQAWKRRQARKAPPGKPQPAAARTSAPEAKLRYR